MFSLLFAFALLLHVVFWGVGLAVLAMPRRWRRFWPVMIVPAGLTLQSLVVWMGAYLDLRGTNSYAWPSELVPAILLVVAARFRSARRWRDDLGRFGLVWVVTGGVLALLVLPLMIASSHPTSISLGSCDAADYAAGARVLREFARSDRTGFLGLTEVVRLISVDNFFDFWLRLNHFTPSALLALNGSVLHAEAYQLTSILTMVVLASSIPLVFWMARAVFGYSGAASLAIAALFGISPIPWYSSAQVSPAPLLAAQAISILNWAGFSLWKGRLTAGAAATFAGLLGIGYSLVLGSYNFIVVVCLVPSAAYAVLGAWTSGNWRRLGKWLVAMLAPLAVCSALWWARVAGLLERFFLFRTHDIGWKIPVLMPEGWLGMIQGGTLRPWNWGGARWVLSAIVVGALAWGLIRACRIHRRRVRIVASVVVPVLAGYGYLEIRGIVLGTNASYDAFKLFTVFFPLLLPAFCWWVTLRWTARLTQWFAVAGLATFVFAMNGLACAMFIVRLSQPNLIVGRELAALRIIRHLPDVRSVNVLCPDMWSRLWANDLMIPKPQYFATTTYEGRRHSPLRGDWDLRSGVVRLELGPRFTRQVTPKYQLVNTHAPGFLRADLGAGWYAEERGPDGVRWRWTGGDALIRIDNPHSRPVRCRPELDGWVLSPGAVSLSLAGTPGGFTPLNSERRRVELPAIEIPPGRSTLVLRCDRPPTTVPGDSRQLSVCVFDLELQLR